MSFFAGQYLLQIALLYLRRPIVLALGLLLHAMLLPVGATGVGAVGGPPTGPPRGPVSW